MGPNNSFYYNKTFDFSPLLKALDLFAVLASAFLTYFSLFNENIFANKEYQIVLFTAGIAVYAIFSTHGLYRSWRGRNTFMQFKAVLTAWVNLYIVLIILSAIFKVTAVYSRLWFFTWATFSLVLLFSFRYFFTQLLRYLRKKGWNHKNIVVFGAGKLGKNVVQRLTDSDWTGFNVVAMVGDDESPANTSYLGAPILNNVDMCKLVAEKQVHELWIALPLKDEDRVNKLLFELRHSTINIRFVPNILGFRLLLNQSISDVAGIATINLNETPMAGINWLVKAIEDRALAFIILILISPIMLLISLLIKLESRGQVIFKQKRHGCDGRAINVYKFRSMYVHKENDGQVTQATKNDSRITKVGAFLRRTSLDELPQFFNVLQGRMSIVGPRPHAIAHNEYYQDQVEYYAQRHRVKPGITGWAQINGWRGETDTLSKMQKRVEYDLYYIQNWSVWFDLKIIALTVLKGFIDDKAY